MADLMSLYADLHGVRAQDPMLQGITQAGAAGDQAEALLMLKQALEYQSRERGGGAAGGMGRAADRLRASNLQRDSMKTLRGALDATQDIGKYEAQLAAIQQQIAAEEERKAKQQAAQAAGWTPGQAQGLAMGIDPPEQPKPESTPNLIKSMQAAGIDPRSPEGRRIIEQNLGGKNTTYNVTPPAGYTFADPTNPAAGFAVIPGSPQARELEEANRTKAETASNERFSAENVLNTIDTAMSSIGEGTAGYGAWLKDLPKSGAMSLAEDLKTIEANLAFDRLQAMRNASKTGGALGQVSERELDFLKATVAGLRQEQDPQKLRDRLQTVRASYERFVNALNGKMPEGLDEQGNPQQQAPADPMSAYEQWKKAQGLQ